jgi:hypothetical protein
MKKLVILVILATIGVPTVATASITVRVCEADGTTLFNNRDIMVGTKLTIIVDSNDTEFWAGDIAILGDLQNYGVLSGRDFNETTGDWEGSHFPAAGDKAVVWTWDYEEGILGFNFSTDVYPTESGDWFVVDYTATAVGDCNVAFYDYSMEPSYFLPSTGAFHHVPTRDFNLDTVVNFADYAVLADWWQQNCESPGGCDGADLNDSSDVDIDDLMLFCDYWLEKTE